MSELTPIVYDTSIKMAAVGLLAWLATRRAGLRSASRAHAIWMVAVAAFVALPLLARVVPPAATLVPSPALREALPAWRVGEPWIAIVYGIGVVAMSARIAIGLAGVRRLIARSLPLVADDADPRATAVLLACARHGAMAGETAALAAPATAGLWRPRVLLPAGWREMAPAALEAMIRHELEHVRRRDYPVVVCAAAVRAIFWFHPIAWLACARLRWFAELAADRAASAPDARAEYASMLLAMASRTEPRASFVLSAASKLGRRVALLIDNPAETALPSIPVVIVVAAAALAAVATVRVTAVAPAPPTDHATIHAVRHAAAHHH